MQGVAQDTWTVAGTAAALNGTADWAETNTANDMTSTDGVNCYWMYSREWYYV